MPLLAAALLPHAEPRTHGEVVAAELLRQRSMQLHRNLAGEFRPVAHLVDCEVFGQDADVAGEGAAVAAAHVLHARLQVAHGCAALGLRVDVLGIGIGECELDGTNALIDCKCTMDLLG